MNEAKFPIQDPATRARLFADLNAAIGALMQAGMDPNEMAEELYGLGEDVEANAMEWIKGQGLEDLDDDISQSRPAPQGLEDF